MSIHLLNLLRAKAYPADIFDAGTRAALAALPSFEKAQDGDVGAIGIFFHNEEGKLSPKTHFVFAVRDGDSFDQPLLRDVNSPFQAPAALAACLLMEDETFMKSVGRLAEERINSDSGSFCMVWVNQHGAIIEDSDMLYDHMAGRTAMADTFELPNLAASGYLGLLDNSTSGFSRIAGGSGLQELLTWVIGSIEYSDDLHSEVIGALSDMELDIREADTTGEMQTWAKHGRQWMAKHAA